MDQLTLEGGTHDDKASGDDMCVHLPPTYIRRTLGCRRRKQGRPRSESFLSLVLTHAVHNRSREWATLNYSGSSSANTTVLTLNWESWSEKLERPKIPICLFEYQTSAVNLDPFLSRYLFCLSQKAFLFLPGPSAWTCFSHHWYHHHHHIFTTNNSFKE